jgi:hypothetical protein
VAAADAPTTPRGTVSTGSMLSGWGGAYDQLEHVADLSWPISIRTYARMRHDPTLASVLSAYALPIMSARWEIDPRGASPDIVKICADSLGLPVRGEPDEPGPVRRRGVQWLDHLRTALGMLTFGHSAFEPVYALTGGRAMLASLGERPQLSIAEIEVDAQGDLTRVTQYGDAVSPNPPAIPADRLLWYVRNKDGANWAGTSLLRHAYGPWLLKQDALRVQATAHRRFGAGTPVAEALAGTNPTQAQLDAAQRVASSIRVGDSGGATMPPGFRLRILGVEGQYPDGLPTIRYHDEQMARGALTSILDLGSTANGSRALGDNFAEILAMAQQGTAGQIAETVTQLCVRLTDFNAGEDAASPAVVPSAIGDNEQALAQSVASLITSGAIVPDDVLEGWLRQVFRAPAKAAPRPAPEPAPAPPAPALEPTKQPVAAASRVVAATGEQPAPDGRRPLTPDEEAAGLDPAAIDQAHEEALAAVLAAWVAVALAQRTSLVEQIATALAGGDREAVAQLVVDTADAADVLAVAMVEAADAGARTAVAEAAAQGVTIAAPTIDTVALEHMAAAITDVMGQTTAATASREALRLAGSTGDVDSQAIADQVGTYLEGLSSSWTETQLSASVSDGIGTGRAAVFGSGPPATYFASEVLDHATCEPCRKIDGHQFDDLDEALAAYVGGWYHECFGRERCRGIVVAKYDDGSFTSPGIGPVRLPAGNRKAPGGV